VLADLASAGVPADVVARAQRDTFFDTPANRAAGLVASYHSVEYGRMEQPGAMWYFGDLNVRLERAPPALGRHTIEALTSVGIDIEEIRLLMEHGAARQG
jgi:crotonobetainyl-CoA:carnitine CoA-transferase CaiB-like acyl-CoA transferase